jgi:hypothetical protein
MHTTALLLAVRLAVAAAGAAQAGGQTTEQPKPAMPVNWLYGAYVPKDVPLVALSPEQRGQLWMRQTFLTPGIYFKTGLFALSDQIADTPPEWHGGVKGFGQRFGSRYAQFAIQTSLSSAANWALGYEPRYDRCKCTGAWPRARHALARNFVTYDATERRHRPQIGSYAGAWGAGLAASTWKPNSDLWKEGYSSMITQAAFGSFANLVGEFAEDLKSALRRKHASQIDR